MQTVEQDARVCLESFELTWLIARVQSGDEIELQLAAQSADPGHRRDTRHLAHLNWAPTAHDEDEQVVADERVLDKGSRGPQITARRIHVALQQREPLHVGGAAEAKLVQHNADARLAVLQLAAQDFAVAGD